MMEVRLLTGPAFVVAGALLLWIALRLWLVRPVNRVFRVGPYVTEAGMRALLGIRSTLFAFGALLTISGANRCAFWFFERDMHAPVIVFLGSLEAGLGLWTAALAVMAGVRICRSG